MLGFCKSGYIICSYHNIYTIIFATLEMTLYCMHADGLLLHWLRQLYTTCKYCDIKINGHLYKFYIDAYMHMHGQSSVIKTQLNSRHVHMIHNL